MARNPLFGSMMDTFGWPNSFLICGAIMLAYSGVWFIFSADRAAEHQWTNEAEKVMVTDEPAIGIQAPAERLSVTKLLQNLCMKGEKDVPIIVEGRKDLKALRSLGFNGRIICIKSSSKLLMDLLIDHSLHERSHPEIKYKPKRQLFSSKA